MECSRGVRDHFKKVGRRSLDDSCLQDDDRHRALLYGDDCAVYLSLGCQQVSASGHIHTSKSLECFGGMYVLNDVHSPESCRFTLARQAALS